MMDGSMFPNGWHFADPEMDANNTTIEAKYVTRYQSPPKYFLTDFGLSRRYDLSKGPPREDPIVGGDKTVPEFKVDPIVPVDPFPTDIYYIGNLIREYIIQVTSGIAPLDDLANANVCAGVQRI